MTYDIAVLPGDGIGPEVVAEALRALRHVEELSGQEVAFRFETHEVGAGAWRRSGEAIQDAAFATCQAANAILFGAVGLPDARHPDGRESGNDVMFRLEADGADSRIQRRRRDVAARHPKRHRLRARTRQARSTCRRT